MPEVEGPTRLEAALGAGILASNSNSSLVGLTRSKASELGITCPSSGVRSVDADIDTCEAIVITDPNRSQCWANLDKKLMEQVVPWSLSFGPTR